MNHIMVNKPEIIMISLMSLTWNILKMPMIWQVTQFLLRLHLVTSCDLTLLPKHLHNKGCTVENAGNRRPTLTIMSHSKHAESSGNSLIFHPQKELMNDVEQWKNHRTASVRAHHQKKNRVENINQQRATQETIAKRKPSFELIYSVIQRVITVPS